MLTLSTCFNWVEKKNMLTSFFPPMGFTMISNHFRSAPSSPAVVVISFPWNWSRVESPPLRIPPKFGVGFQYTNQRCLDWFGGFSDSVPSENRPPMESKEKPWKNVKKRNRSASAAWIFVYLKVWCTFFCWNPTVRCFFFFGGGVGPLKKQIPFPKTNSHIPQWELRKLVQTQSFPFWGKKKTAYFSGTRNA